MKLYQVFNIIVFTGTVPVSLLQIEVCTVGSREKYKDILKKEDEVLGLKEDILTEANHYVADIKKEALVVEDKVKTAGDLEELDSYIETVKDEVKLEIRQAYIC